MKFPGQKSSLHLRNPNFGNKTGFLRGYTKRKHLQREFQSVSLLLPWLRWAVPASLSFALGNRHRANLPCVNQRKSHLFRITRTCIVHGRSRKAWFIWTASTVLLATVSGLRGGKRLGNLNRENTITTGETSSFFKVSLSKPCYSKLLLVPGFQTCPGQAWSQRGRKFQFQPQKPKSRKPSSS